MMVLTRRSNRLFLYGIIVFVSTNPGRVFSHICNGSPVFVSGKVPALRRIFADFLKILEIRVRLVRETLISIQNPKRKRRQRTEVSASVLPSGRQLSESAYIGRDVKEVG